MYNSGIRDKLWYFFTKQYVLFSFYLVEFIVSSFRVRHVVCSVNSRISLDPPIFDNLSDFAVFFTVCFNQNKG